MTRHVIYNHYDNSYVGKNAYKKGLLHAIKFHEKSQAQKHAHELSQKHDDVALEVKTIYFGEYYGN